MFAHGQRVLQVEQTGQEVQILGQSIQEMRAHMNKTLGDTLAAINLAKEQSLLDILSLQKQVTGNGNRLEDQNSRVRHLEDESGSLAAKLTKANSALVQQMENTLQLDKLKLSQQEANQRFDKVACKLRKLKEEGGQLANQQVSLENWVEKYLPLKLHHMTVETVAELLPEDKQQRLFDISKHMQKVLRKDIMDD